MENSVFESIYIGISTFVFIAAISVSITLMITVRDTAELAIEKVNNLESNVITMQTYNPDNGQVETNINDITIINGNEIIATYVESIKKDWVNKDYEFLIYQKNKGFVPLNKDSVKDVIANSKYKRTIESKVNLINYDKGYEIKKIVVKYEQKG